MKDFLFYLCSALTLCSSLLVVLNRNAVNSAMFMIVAFISTAGLFFLLDAYFLGILQILVYAGAVMVLFLFVIMLLNVEAISRKGPDWPSLVASMIGLIIMLAAVFYIAFKNQGMNTVHPIAIPDMPTADQPFIFTSSAKSYGLGLYTKYMLPLQVAGFLLLIAMVGVIVISKRDQSIVRSEKIDLP